MTAPAGDFFANRQPVILPYPATPNIFYVTGSNLGATKETGEPWHGGQTYYSHGGQSVWWTWTAPANGRASVAALPQRYVFSSLVGVYTGTAVNSLTRIGNAYS